MTRKDLNIIAIGERFDPYVETFPEGCHYNYDISGHWIYYLYQNPTEEEISSIQSGEIDFGLYVRGPILFLLHKFGDMNWNDSSYSWWLVSDEFRAIPDRTEGHASIKTILIDSETGLVKAMRACTLSQEFTVYLHDTIRMQTQQSWNRELHEEAVHYIYSRYSTQNLVDMAEIFCKGGE